MGLTIVGSDEEPCEVKSDDLRSRVERRRIETNERLSGKVLNNEHIETPFTPHDSWFPPRPIIKKDKNVISRLYGPDDKPII